MLNQRLPLVSEQIGFKLKKLNFNWKVNQRYSEIEGFQPSITESGVNYNSDTLIREENFGNICSISIIALAVQWLEIEHGLFIGKDWINRKFNIVDLKGMEAIKPLNIVSLDGAFETPDVAMLHMVDLALDYLSKCQNACFGDVVLLTNKSVGRCIGNNKAVYFPDAPVMDRAEVGDVDIEFLRVHGKYTSPDKYSVPSMQDIKQFEIPVKK